MSHSDPQQNQAGRRKHFLFVDDDLEFLGMLKQVSEEMSHGAWDILTAGSLAQALTALRRQRMDVVVLDMQMPVMDGLQLLRLLNRIHPGLQVVILTGQPDEALQKECLRSGAALFLEKVISPDGFAGMFATLEALADAAGLQEGFHGLMRRVGLQEVIQLECLGRKSSILEVRSPKIRGRIYICDGSIVHAESGKLQGEVALYGLLGLRGGEFNLLAYTEPHLRTIAGQWESLLMEGARLTDENTDFFGANESMVADRDVSGSLMPTLSEPDRISVEEILLCSGSGEILYQWHSEPPETRLRWMEQLEQQALQLSSLVQLGCFSRLQIEDGLERITCELQPHHRLFVRTRASQEVRHG